MEKLVVKGKKEIRMHLADALHQTIQALGISKTGKKSERLIKKSSKKLAALVGKQMKKELNKISKLRKKTERKKEHAVELATA
ncbi:MAG TPA: hypothetical protein VGQ59_09540 [Cyclobacteriaceae bacterium]|nr:hypothetical protein [Cyclobacteriaceae bacterium]